MSNSLKALTASPVELLAGLVLIVLGVVAQVQGSGSSVVLMVAGGIGVAVGGILLSWIASKELGERQTLEAVDASRQEIDSKLDSLSRVLGQAAGQIGQAVQAVESGQSDSRTGFALVSQATRMIYGQVNEIAVIRGTSFDSAYLLETASQLDDLARRLTSPDVDERNELAEVRKELAAVKANLSAGAAAQRSFSLEPVACPYCENVNRVRLGSLGGDTASASCAACSERFNVHRNAAGRAFSRPVGPAGPEGVVPTPPPSYSFACPDCGGGLTARARSGATSMVCPTCFLITEVDPGARTVESVGTARKTYPSTFRRSGTRPVVTCPDCGARKNALLLCDEGFFAMCGTDQLVMIVSQADFDRFRAEEDASAVA